MGKSINVDFDQNEFEKASKAKGALTWKEVILRNLPKSDEDILKDETERYFKRLIGWALMNKNSKLNAQFNFMKDGVISILDHKTVMEDLGKPFMIESKSAPKSVKPSKLSKPTRSPKSAENGKKRKTHHPKRKR